MEISHTFRSRKEAAAGLLSLCNHGVFVSSLQLRWGHRGCSLAERICHVKRLNFFEWASKLDESHFAVVFIVYFLTEVRHLLYFKFLPQDWGYIAKQSSEDNYIELQGCSWRPWQHTRSCHSQGPLICYWPRGGPLSAFALSGLINYHPNSGLSSCHNQMVNSRLFLQPSELRGSNISSQTETFWTTEN